MPTAFCRKHRFGLQSGRCQFSLCPVGLLKTKRPPPDPRLGASDQPRSGSGCGSLGKHRQPPGCGACTERSRPANPPQESPGCVCLHWDAGAGGCVMVVGGLQVEDWPQAAWVRARIWVSSLRRRSLCRRTGGEEGRRGSRGFPKAFAVVRVSVWGREVCQCRGWGWRVPLPASFCTHMSHHVVWHLVEKFMRLCFTGAHVHMHSCPVCLERCLATIVQGERLFLVLTFPECLFFILALLCR